MGKENILRDEIISVGRHLYERGLTVAKSGNLSARLDDATILITTSGSFLGNLSDDDITRVNLATGEPLDGKKPSSELPLHSLVYKNFPVWAVVHCHPALINGYFAVCDNLKALTFEGKVYLGNLAVIPQDTPTVTNPDPVIAALKSNNIVVLKHHGAVSIANTFSDALGLVEALEEAVRSASVARLFQKEVLDSADLALKDDLTKHDQAHVMFSKEHIQAIVDLVNKDELIAQKGKELGLTVQLAIKLDGDERSYKFNFEQGVITRLDCDADAPYVISAPAEVWRQVFLGKLDSFVAVTQGKMKLQGQLGQLSKWYVPFNRLFSLFRQVPIVP